MIHQEYVNKYQGDIIYSKALLVRRNSRIEWVSIDNKKKVSCYSEEQMRRIVVAGIRGWGAKVARCGAEGRRVRRTAKDSLELRMRTKLRHSSSTRHFGRNHHVVLVVSWSNCPNFNQKFNFKLLCPLKNKNPTYGSKVTAISNTIRC